MDVSVIVPYYNDGAYLRDALNSIALFKKYPQYSYEVIVINDGSTDAVSLALLEEIKNEGYIVIDQQNQRVAAARNTGLRIAKGRYMLFLDSDNIMREAFITKGLPVLESGDADIVYGKAKFFGASNQPVFRQDVMHLPTLMARNYIDVCSLIRREVYEKLGDFDTSPVLNMDDWEYWIRAVKAGFKFRFVDVFFYDYRLHARSMSSAINDETYHQARKYIYEKYPEQVLESYFYLTQQFHNYRQDKKRPLRSFFKYFYLKYLRKKDPNIPR